MHMAYGIAIAIGRHGENRERCDKERKKRQLRQDSRMNKKCSQVIVSRLRLVYIYIYIYIYILIYITKKKPNEFEEG